MTEKTGSHPDSTEERAFVRRELDGLFQRWLALTCFLGAAMFLLLIALDHVAAPELASRFMTYRFIIAAVLVAAGGVTLQVRSLQLLIAIGMAVILLSGASIEVMILEFGGHRSLYFAGQILLIVAVAGFIPARTAFHAAAALMVSAIYVLPILVYDEIADGGAFLTAAFFVCFVAATMVVIRYLANRRLLAMLRAQWSAAAQREELEAANRRLKEADRMKSMFLASMSHELRTPLNAIIGFSGIMLQGMTGELNDEQRHQLELVRSSGDHLLSLINDVIDVSKIEAGVITPVEREFDLGVMLREAVDMMRGDADRRGLQLSVNAPATLPVVADDNRVRQVVMNLVVNAVKYTSSGAIEVRATVLGGVASVEVADTGLGVSAEDREIIFQPFGRLKDRTGRREKGSGLGLYLSRSIARHLGGDLTLLPAGGIGCTFAFTFPVSESGAALES